MKYSTKRGVYHYEIYGEGPALIMLHGFTGSRKTWYPFLERLTESFQLILIDLPGHGKTRVTKTVTMEACCADLYALIDYLHLEKVSLLGYSMGGRTALSFAMYYPELVQMLLLESASPGLNSSMERKQRQQKDEALAEWLEKVKIERFVSYWEDLPLFYTQKRLSETVQNQLREERLHQTEEGLAYSLKGMGTGKQPNWWPELSRLRCRVVLLVGELDEKFVHLNGEMSDHIINSQIISFFDTGHAIHVEQPEKFGKIVEELLLTQK